MLLMAIMESKLYYIILPTNSKMWFQNYNEFQGEILI